MKISQQFNFIVVNKQANSLYSLITDGKYRNTSLGRNTWKKLIGSQASLQLNCNMEGFNAVSFFNSSSKARIGIISNQQNDCNSCDSRIGFGKGGEFDESNTCGNEASRNPDNGNKHIKAMGYTIVQWEGTDEVTGRAIQFNDILILVPRPVFFRMFTEATFKFCLSPLIDFASRLVFTMLTRKA